MSICEISRKFEKKNLFDLEELEWLKLTWSKNIWFLLIKISCSQNQFSKSYKKLKFRKWTRLHSNRWYEVKVKFCSWYWLNALVSKSSWFDISISENSLDETSNRCAYFVHQKTLNRAELVALASKRFNVCQCDFPWRKIQTHSLGKRKRQLKNVCLNRSTTHTRTYKNREKQMMAKHSWK